MNLLVVCHFGLLKRHFASISGHIFLIQNLMYSMLNCSTAMPVMFFLTFALLLSILDTKVWFNKP